MARRSPRSVRRRWLHLVRLQVHSGLSQLSFCRRRRISLHQFRAWKYKHLARLESAISTRYAARPRAQPAGSRRVEPAFLPLRVIGREPDSTAPTAAALDRPGSPFEIVLRDGCRVLVPASFDPERLRGLLKVLEVRE